MVMKTTTNTDNNQQKKATFSRRKCRSEINQNFCSENIISDLLAVLSKLTGTIDFRIIGKESNLQKKFEFFF